MSRLFNRFVVLSLIRPSITTARDPNGFFAQQPNAIIIREMRIKFSVEKNLGKHPNKASVTVTNLAESTRAQIKVPMIVRLEVGYDGTENLQHLFSGDLRLEDTEHSGPDVETKLEMGEGDRAYQFAHVSQSFRGAKVIDAVRTAASALGLDVPANVAGAPDMQAEYTGTIHGPAGGALTKLLTPAGYGWSVQEGKLVALKDDQIRPGQAIPVNEQEGMIGSPKLGVPKKPGEATQLKVKKLIDPRVVAGCTISVKSRDVNWLFRFEKVKHDGDSRSKDWYTDIDARQM